MVWLKYIACLVIILFAGTKLARYGDAIAEKTGLSGLWIGLVLIAAITSVPELVTGVSSVALVGFPAGPDLALGTLFGSCLFNLALLALLDILYRPAPILSKVHLRQAALAGVGILLIAVAAGSIWVEGGLSGLALGWVGIPSIVILLLYLIMMRQMFRFERSHPVPKQEAVSLRYAEITMRTVYLRFILAALAVIGAGIWVSFVGEEIARTTGWSASFVGSLFLAISSSMPELVVTIVALRLGALDMAVAGILGSNMFNIAIIFAVDLFYTQGPVLSTVSSTHLTTAAVAMVMSLLVIVGLRFRQKRKTFGVISWYGLALIGLYIFGAYALFTSGLGLG